MEEGSVSNETNEFKIAGKVERVEKFTSKNGKDIYTIILAVDGKYPQLVPLKCFGRQGDDARDLQHGTGIVVTGHLGGRDFNGKVYGDNIADRIDVVQQPERQAELPVDDTEPPF